MRRAISRLLTPALQCKEFVHGELLRIAGQSAPVDVARFPGLQVGIHMIRSAQQYLCVVQHPRRHRLIVWNNQINDLCQTFHSHSCALQRRLMTAVEDFINEGAAPAERMIRDLVACEHAYINTDHPSFVGGNRAIAQVSFVAPCDMPLHKRGLFRSRQLYSRLTLSQGQDRHIAPTIRSRDTGVGAEDCIQPERR